MRLLGLVGWGHRGCRWGCCGPVPRGHGGAVLGPGSGLLSFLGSAEVSALRIENVGPGPQLWKGAHLPRPCGLFCSFIWGFLPWAWCPDPKEAPAFLATDCQCSLLPSWPCCQRPLVPGWVCMRARASGIRWGPQRSLISSSACLWESRGWSTRPSI